MNSIPEGLEFVLKKERRGFTSKLVAEKDGITYFKKQGSNVVYKSINDGCYCTKCGHSVLSAEVVHPLWDPNFTCGGGGNTVTETVPYCPNCETKPNKTGNPCYESRADLF